MNFKIVKQDSNTQARLGKLTLPNGEVETPVFMPVGTQGTVKTISYRYLSCSAKCRFLERNSGLGGSLMALKNLPGDTGPEYPGQTPVLSGPQQAQAINAHISKRHKHRERPCPNPPAVPGGITLQFRATEAKTHLEWSGRLKWSEVTQDEQGHGTKISRCEAQILPCDVSGNVLDKVDDKWTIRTKVKQPVRYANVKLATNPSGNTFRFECRTNHGQSVNNQIIASGFTPSAYNGTWTVSNIVNPTTLEVTGGSSGVGDSTAEGKIEDADDRLHITMEKVPKPKTWYWKARVRAVDSKDCRGDWSAWTTPILPWAGADPVPPTPTYGANTITFDNKGKGKHSKTRLKFLFNEVQIPQYIDFRKSEAF